MNHHIVVRYKNRKNILEILCDKRYFKDYNKLSTISAKKAYLPKILVVDTIFSNYKKGNVARRADIQSITGTTTNTDAFLFILEHGKTSLSSSERKQLVEQKRAAIVHYFVSNFLNPTNNKPHPPARIDAALKEIKALVIKPHTPVEIQAQEIFKKLKYLLPLKKNLLTVTIDFFYAQLGPGLNLLRKYATIIREEYEEDHVTFEVEISKEGYDHVLRFLSHDSPDVSNVSKKHSPSTAQCKRFSPRQRKSNRSSSKKSNR